MDLRWTAVPDRYDFRRYKCLRVSGATPTTDAEDAGATEITIVNGSTRTTSRLTDDPTNGTWSYSVFVVYDEYNSSTDERYSIARTYTATVTAAPTPTPTSTPTPTPSPTP